MRVTSISRWYVYIFSWLVTVVLVTEQPEIVRKGTKTCSIFLTQSVQRIDYLNHPTWPDAMEYTVTQTQVTANAVCSRFTVGGPKKIEPVQSRLAQYGLQA